VRREGEKRETEVVADKGAEHPLETAGSSLATLYPHVRWAAPGGPDLRDPCWSSPAARVLNPLAPTSHPAATARGRCPSAPRGEPYGHAPEAALPCAAGGCPSNPATYRVGSCSAQISRSGGRGPVKAVWTASRSAG
jgi:hypothetical protein